MTPYPFARLAKACFRFAPLILLAAGCTVGPQQHVESSPPAPASPRVEPSQELVSTAMLVVGGTPAGVAAAVAAARRGVYVTLVTSSDRLGGVLTDAMMNQWDFNRDVDKRVVQRGIFEEVLDHVGQGFTPEAGAERLAAFVASQPRITVRYRYRLTGVDVKAGQISAIRFVRAGGAAPLEICAQLIVDATDDADVAVAAGARYQLGRQSTGLDRKMQPVTLMAALSGGSWDELTSNYAWPIDGPGVAGDEVAWGYSRILAGYKPLFGETSVRDLNLGRMPGGLISLNAVDMSGVDALDPVQAALAIKRCRLETERLIAFLRPRVPGLEGARIAYYARQLYARETRHIVGRKQLSGQDIFNRIVPPDSIGLASYPLDIHPIEPSDHGLFDDVTRVYGLPFGALVPAGFANIVVVGPAISATHYAAGSARVVPTTVVEGEAAGAAGALALRDHIDFAGLASQPSEIAHLRTDLAAAGVAVGEPTNEDWPSYRHDINNSGASAGPATITTLRFIPKWTYTAKTWITSTPIRANGKILAGTWGGDVIALDDATGTLIWSNPLGANGDMLYGQPRGVVSSIAAGGGSAYAISGSCVAAAFDIDRGTKLWQRQVCDPSLNDDTYASPVIAGDVILFGIDILGDRPTDAGQLVALDRKTGSLRWTFRPAPAGTTGDGISATAALDLHAGLAFVGSGNPTPTASPPSGPDPGSLSIFALDLETGKPRWSFGPLYPHDVHDRDFFASPNRFKTAAGWTIGEADKDATYVAIDEATGRERWRQHLREPGSFDEIIGTPAIAGGHVFATLEGTRGAVVAFDAEDGHVVWRVGLDAGSYEAPVVYGSALIVTETTGSIVVLDRRSGRVIRKISVGGRFAGRGPSVAGDVLFYASDNRLRAEAIETR